MIKIGQITTTHGYKGEVKVLPLTDDPKRFKKLEYVFLQMPRGYEKAYLEQVRFHQEGLIVKFKEVIDMTSAERLRNIYICITEEQLLKLPEGHYYIFQIIGMDVHEGDTYLGQVKDIIQTGSNDVYIVQKGTEKEILIPALKEIVKDIDIENRIISVNLPEGLID
ncbi:MAG: ribosome maturation factor RimM [Bacillota bacterium]